MDILPQFPLESTICGKEVPPFAIKESWDVEITSSLSS
jgi:hypothetical protein